MNLSIRARLTLSILAVVTVIVSFQGWYFPHLQEQAATEALESKAHVVAELIASQNAVALDMNYQSQAQEALEGALQDSDLLSVALFRPDGPAFAAAPPEADVPPPLPWPVQITIEHLDEGVRVLVPFTTRAGDEGLLVAWYSTAELTAQRHQSRQRALLIGLMAIAVGLGLSWLVANSFSDRVRTMAHAIETVADGRLNVPRVPDAEHDELGDMARSLNVMLASLRSVERSVQRLGMGDLSLGVAGHGDLVDALNRTLNTQRELVRQLTETSSAIQHTASDILAASRLQENGAEQLATVIQQTSHKMDVLYASGERIAESSMDVLKDADHTHADTLLISSRIYQLASHSERIGEILELIREIAGKSELLAINAALEGTRAGEAGRGFGLVATQMHRLTEQIVGAVRDIHELNDDIHRATAATISATAEMTARASSTAQAARHIRKIIQGQADVTGNVSASMSPIALVVRENVAATHDNVQAATALQQLASRLSHLVARFVLTPTDEP